MLVKLKTPISWVAISICIPVTATWVGINGSRPAPVVPTEPVPMRCLNTHDSLEIKRTARAIQADTVIGINVVSPGINSEERERAVAALNDSIRVWRSAILDFGEVRLVEFDEPSDIKLEFKRSVSMSGEPVAGSISWRRDSGTGEKVYIQVAMNHPRGEPFAARTITNIISHEIGHSLGLEDSSNPAGVMRRIDTTLPVIAPSQDEVTAVRQIRHDGTKSMCASRMHR